MNRAERRKAARQGVDHKTLHQIQKEAVKKGISETVASVLACTLMTLRDEFGFGEVRAKRFMEHFHRHFDDINTGHVSLADIKQTMEEELRVSFEVKD